VPLTNDIPFGAGPASAFAAPPGPPRQFFFQFQVTNEVDSILFEMYNLSGDADLVVQRDLPPTMAPYYGESFRDGTNWEQVVARVSPEVPSLQGNWYVGIYNNQGSQFRLHASGDHLLEWHSAEYPGTACPKCPGVARRERGSHQLVLHRGRVLPGAILLARIP
jgi:hypothetical protein